MGGGASEVSAEEDFDELDDSQIERALDAELEEEPVASSGPPMASRDTQSIEEEAFTSETLAELYAEQGLRDKAARMYERLLIQDPDNPRYLARLDALQEPEPTREVFAEPSPLPAAEPVPVFSETREQLLADISALRDPSRGEKLTALEQWLSAIEQDRKRA